MLTLPPFSTSCSPDVLSFPSLLGNDEISGVGYNQTADAQTPEETQNGTTESSPEKGIGFTSTGAAAPAVALGLVPQEVRCSPTDARHALAALHLWQDSPGSPDPKVQLKAC